MDPVTIHDLVDLWPDSHGEPYTLIEQDDPTGQVGSYVIEPGERVPPSGTTSHEGAEISVILEGELKLVTDEEYRLGAGSVVILQPGVEHWSENVGDEPARLIYTILGEI